MSGEITVQVRNNEISWGKQKVRIGDGLELKLKELQRQRARGKESSKGDTEALTGTKIVSRKSILREKNDLESNAC